MLITHAVARVLMDEVLAAEAAGLVRRGPGGTIHVDGQPWWDWVAAIAVRLGAHAGDGVSHVLHGPVRQLG